MTKEAAIYAALMKKAEETVQWMDSFDGGSEADRLPSYQALRTAMLALYAAMTCGNWNTVAEAMVMLQQIELKYRPADERGEGVFLGWNRPESLP